ncbi:LytS/YhcK type 5TM receptor domain-containing protein [Clostridium sp.]|uniref:LytS/YhcK type 5TM receptor domain-containing protein n=1 Tax=Clostridium sp. TaxID=1506 RepID=UPI002FC6323F
MLYIELLQRMSLVALSAYFFTRIKTFKNLIQGKISKKDKLIMIIFFSLLSIMGNYLGIDIVDKALANIRPIGVIVAGYIGGPLVGGIVGIIGGYHRYTFGGFTALACAVASFFEGMVGYVISKKPWKDDFSIKGAFYAGIWAEVTQFIIILIMAKPLEKAIILEKIIFLPMTLVNTLGVVIFIAIVKEVKNDLLNSEAVQAHKALRIAKKATFYMKSGFVKENIEKFIDAIYDVANVKGVFITNEKFILGIKNINLNNEDIQKSVESIRRNKSRNANLIYEENDIWHEKPIVIHSILINDKYRGAIGIKVKSRYEIRNYFNLCEELSSIIADEIEMYELNKIAEEGIQASYKALREQIHPHFLFNSLATIASLCRTDSEKARKLILELSNYFRTTLKRKEDFISLEEELEFLISYLKIEESRFGDRLQISIEIGNELDEIKVPVFILQPLVENAIKHGILPKIQGGSIDIVINEKDNYIEFEVKDDGVGMEKDKINNILLYETSGIGIKNVNERLRLLYGEESLLRIESILGKGTKVCFKIPKEKV